MYFKVLKVVNVLKDLKVFFWWGNVDAGVVGENDM